jgi:hypothetical protein
MVQILMTWWSMGQEVKGTAESEVIKGIINTPPGGGKTTTITHDFPAWVLGRNRETRTALGSRTSGQAEKYTRRLRNTLEKNPLLNLEFGRFKPIDPERWRVNDFIIDGVVGQPPSLDYKLSLAGFDPEDPRVKRRLRDPEDEIHEILDALANVFLTGEKESSVFALSQDMGFLGGRFDLNLWDDLCDKNNSKTVDQREGLTEWWFSEAESRCEPGGIVALIGTRFGKYDLYRHCRDLEYSSDDDIDEAVISSAHSGLTEEELAEIKEDIEREMVDRYGHNYAELHTATSDGQLRQSRRVYRYFKFPAHDDPGCEHPRSLKNTDHVECVLDPLRFSFRHLLKAQSANPRRYQITYQQEDESTEDNLVQKIWLTGGSDNDGIIYPGCYDYDRRLLVIPEDLKKEDCFSIATVDPSAQNWWSIQWWLWDAEEDQDYLVDILRARLTAGGLLDWNRRKDEFDGVMESWQNYSRSIGWPIGLWIVEENGAQRYLFQHKWTRDWQRYQRVLIKGHETQSNKADSEFGIETLAPRYRQGLVNLPYSQDDLKTRVKVNEFAAELTEWPDYPTEDMVMGHWFLQFNRYNLPSSLRVSEQMRGSRVIHPYADDMPGYVKEDRKPRNQRGNQAVGHKNARLRRLRDLG